MSARLLLLEHGLPALLLSTMVLGAGLLAGRLLLRRRPHSHEERLFLYRATFCAALTACSLSSLLGSRWASPWSFPAVAAARSFPASAADSPTAAAGNVSVPSEPFPADGRNAAIAARTRLYGDLVPLGLLAVWGAGALYLLGGLLRSHIHLMRLARVSVAVESPQVSTLLRELQDTAPPDRRPLSFPLLRTSSDVPGPFLAGLRHPVIYLPASFEADYDRETLRAILAHEIAHQGQSDCAWNFAVRLANALSWPQPLLFLLRRRMEEASEMACDRAALAQHVPPRAYARCLVTLAEQQQQNYPVSGKGGPLSRAPAAGTGMLRPFRPLLEERIRHIMTPAAPQPSARQRRRSRIALSVSAVCLTAAAAAFFGGRLVPIPAALAAQPQPPPAEAAAADPLAGKIVTMDVKNATLRGKQKKVNRFVEARLISQLDPLLPEALRRREYSPFLLLTFRVSAKGDSEVSILRGSRNPEIDHRILQAARRWRWLPATRDGKPVASVRQYKYLIPR